MKKIRIALLVLSIVAILLGFIGAIVVGSRQYRHEDMLKQSWDRVDMLQNIQIDIEQKGADPLNLHDTFVKQWPNYDQLVQEYSTEEGYILLKQHLEMAEETAKRQQDDKNEWSDYQFETVNRNEIIGGSGVVLLIVVIVWTIKIKRKSPKGSDQ